MNNETHILAELANKDGDVFPPVVMEEPEFLGKLSIKQELTILKADKPNIDIGWKCFEYQGAEILRKKKEYSYITNNEIIKGFCERKEESVHSSNTMKYLEVIKEKDSLKVEDEVLVFRFFDIDFAKIRENNDSKELYAETSYSLFFLEFGKDDRNCWVCGGECNKSALAMFDVKG